MPIAVYNQKLLFGQSCVKGAPVGVGGQLFTIAPSGSNTLGAASWISVSSRCCRRWPGRVQADADRHVNGRATPVVSYLAQTPVNASGLYLTPASTLTVGFTTYSTGANPLSGDVHQRHHRRHHRRTVGNFIPTGAAASSRWRPISSISAAPTASILLIGFNAMTSPFGVSNAQSCSIRSAATGGLFGTDSAALDRDHPRTLRRR